MRYIEYLDIKSFRGLRDVKIEDVGEINILVGKNNSGKTSLLEVIRLLEYPTEIGNYVRISRSRESRVVSANFGMVTPYESFINLFDKKNNRKEIGLTAVVNGSTIDLLIKGHEEKILKSFNNRDINQLKLPPEEEKYQQVSLFDTDKIVEEEIYCFKGTYRLEIDSDIRSADFELDESERAFPIRDNRTLALLDINYVSPIDHYVLNSSLRSLNNAIKAGLKSEISDMLKIFDDGIIGIELLEENRRIVPYIDHKQLGLMPLSTFGDGIKKALTLASSIIDSKGGVLLVDEIETAIHTKALTDFIGWFIQACEKYRVQVFLTTHSIEAIDAIIDGGRDYLNKIVGYRLENINNKAYVSKFSGNKLYDIRKKLGLDVR